MNKFMLLLIVAALSGCAGSEDSDPASTPVADPEPESEAPLDDGEPVEDPVAPGPSEPAPEPADEPNVNETEVQNTTVEPPVEETVEPAQEETLVSEHWEGTAPAAVAGEGALFIEGTFDIVGTPTNVHVVQVSEYIGIVSAVLYIYDATGAERAVATDDCGWTIAPGALESYTCDVTFTENLMSGEWSWRLVWQVGEVAETYTIDATVMGYAAA